MVGQSSKLGQSILRMTTDLCFAALALIVLVFTIIAASYNSPIHSPTTRIATFLASSSSSVSDTDGEVDQCSYNATDPIDCRLPEVHHLMMRHAIDLFRDAHFYKFGKPVTGGSDGGSCDMAWRFRSIDANRPVVSKDYRRFELSRSPNCTYSVIKVGDYHSGVHARKERKSDEEKVAEPEIDEPMSNTLPVTESEAKFITGKYLVYSGGGDRCKSMNHYLWSLLCALGEAHYLDRTFIMDLSMCLSKMHTSSNQDEEGKDFRFYFDFEHLKNTASVLNQTEFWNDWSKWQKKDRLSLLVVEDFRREPMKLRSVDDSLIMRKFGDVEPDNYWYRVCEGEAESVIQRPWKLIRKSKRLLEIVSGIASRLKWDFDSVHIVRGKTDKGKEISPDSLLSTLRDKIDEGRNLYIATDKTDTSFFDPLKSKYKIHFLDEFKDLWNETSEWYKETMLVNDKVPVEFDGYMRDEVGIGVFSKGKKKIETSNDLTNDCKDGSSSCRGAAP